MAQWDEIIPGSFGLLLTGGAAGWFLWQWVKVIASKRWPTIEGEIASSRVVEKRSGKSMLTHAEISYSYEVVGRYYKANQVCFGDFLTANAGVARERVRDYPVGRAVTVHYNPRNPAEATLLPRGTFMLAFWPTLALFVFAMILGEMF